MLWHFCHAIEWMIVPAIVVHHVCHADMLDQWLVTNIEKENLNEWWHKAHLDQKENDTSVTCLASVPNRTSNTLDKSIYRSPQGLTWFKLIDLLLIKGENNKTYMV